MEAISVFDIFKIGVGPSSSHTMGPWRAAQRFLARLDELAAFDHVTAIRVDLFGSLAKTGMGHGTDVAILLGLSGDDPVTCDTATIAPRFQAMRAADTFVLQNNQSKKRIVPFNFKRDVVFNFAKSLPFHANALTFTATLDTGKQIEETYYSVGGGFVVQDPPTAAKGALDTADLPFPMSKGEDVLKHTRAAHKPIPEIVLTNERTWRSDADVRKGLLNIWQVMQECIYRGCHTPGVLPGGLNVVRRAAAMNGKLLSPSQIAGAGARTEGTPHDLPTWLRRVRHSTTEFQTILKWVSTFALAVNEENAAFGRVVTAPTNGAAGVIPAVMMYYWCFCTSTEQGIIDFMLTAGEIGSLFKKGATISAAMGGCQAEIGVSSAMAAAGLTQCLGGTPEQALMAAEIAMEHHLGMTCDPIGGLVQIPCIERNTMGAIKAITAANIALESDPATAKVSLDNVIKTMWETAKDMGTKYKETAEGGLAIHVSVGIPEC